MLTPRLVFATLVLLAACAHADEVYKCTDAGGGVAYQDHPCPANTSATQMHLPDAPAVAPQPEPADVAPPEPAAKPPPEPATPRAPLPALWVCANAEDGKPYVSENGTPAVRYVPLGTLGYPGKSLAHAYGPGGGSGISAPGVNPIPITRSPGAIAATQYTPLQDVCAPASREQACGYLRKQYDEVEHKLRGAFKDERAVLEPRERILDAQLDNC